MSKYEVTYEYVVSGLSTVEATSEENAADLVKMAIEKKNPTALDFEVFSTRLVDGD